MIVWNLAFGFPSRLWPEDALRAEIPLNLPRVVERISVQAPETEGSWRLGWGA